MDDDCDGVIDQQLIERLGGAVHVSTAVNAKVGSIAFVTPTNGTANVLSRPGLSGEIAVASFDVDGNVERGRGLLAGTGAFRNWLVASDGFYAALVASKSDPATKTAALVVQLYSANGMQQMGEFSDFDREPCVDVYPTGVDVVRDAAGAARLAIVRILSRGKQRTDGSCEMLGAVNENLVHFMSFTPGVGFMMASTVGLGPWVGHTRVSAIPCTEQWLVAGLGQQQVLRRYSYAGQLVDSKDGRFPGRALHAVKPLPDSLCSTGVSTLYALSTPDSAQPVSDVASELTELRLDRAADSLTVVAPAATLFPAPISESTLHVHGRRVFVSGLDNNAMLQLLELSAGIQRRIELKPVDVASVVGDITDGYSELEHSMTAVAWAGDALLVGTTATPLFKGAEDFRAQGDLDPPVAVTYRVGCK